MNAYGKGTGAKKEKNQIIFVGRYRCCLDPGFVMVKKLELQKRHNIALSFVNISKSL